MARLTNPYPRPRPGEARHVLIARVSPDEAYFLRRLGGMMNGTYDVIFSNLIKIFCDELRSRGLDPNNPDHLAFGCDHPTFAIFADVLDVLRGRTTGIPPGDGGTGPRNDERATLPLREGDGTPPSLSPNPPSVPAKGVVGPGRDEEDDEEEGGGPSGSGGSVPGESPGLVKLLLGLYDILDGPK